MLMTVAHCSLLRSAGVVARIDSLPLFYAMWIGRGASQAVVLMSRPSPSSPGVYGPRYKQCDPVMTFLGGLASTFGIPFTQVMIERIGWRPSLEVLGPSTCS